MKHGKTQHVVPHPDGWAVRGEGNQRITSLHRSLDDALASARHLIAGRDAAIYIHRPDGPEQVDSGA